VLAWHAAFQDVGLQMPSARLHRLIGMGGDRLVAAAAGDAVEASLGDELRSLHPQHLDRLFRAITPTDGAQEMVEALHRTGADLVLASSSDAELTDRLLEVVPGVRALLTRIATGSDADRTKPDGELLAVAIGDADPAATIAIGDAVWDVHAAHDVGARCLALLTGGISEAELREAGADDVLPDPAVLVQRLAGGRDLL
jgi:phosphoglycolate phosphatase-like HAD superfamily hydrolase